MDKLVDTMIVAALLMTNIPGLVEKADEQLPTPVEIAEEQDVG